MIKIIFAFFVFITALSTVNAQKGIDFNKTYPGGGRLLMNVDSSAKNVYYVPFFRNQPNTSFKYLPEVDSVNIQINFRQKDSVENFRYTILADDKPIVVNKSIDLAQLKDTHAGGDEEIFRSTKLGVFLVKDKTLTILIYRITDPLNIQKSVFYGKHFPRAKITGFLKHFTTDKGFDSSWIIDPEKKIDLTFTEKDYQLTLLKNQSDIDYLYYTTIINKQTNKVVFESTAWKYGGIVAEDESGYLPYVDIDKSVFKKSGDYEIIIQPLMDWKHCWECGISATETEKYSSRYTLSINLDQESYTKKELLTYTLIAVFSLGSIFLVILYFTRKRNKKRLSEKERQKNTAKLQLNSIRSQLNPHFLFNALAGIQNLINKSEIDNANKYLSKFARLTRNVLDDKELVSLSQEKDLLHDYLQMEQLRFSFTYIINHSEDLDLDNVEIPSMLLQPFVENAVKHGISQLATRGEIIIAFIKQEKDLVLTVTDNGQGFDLERKNKGLGLPLSDSRIALLNSVYKENRFILGIISTTDGTKISLTLTDWL